MANDPKKEIVRINALGLAEGVCPETGAILWTEKKKPTKRGRPRKPHPSAQIETPKLTPAEKRVYNYSVEIADLILMHISQGKTLEDVGLMQGFPAPVIIYKWMREHPDFKAHYKLAKEARAEVFANKTLKIAEETNRRTVAPDKLKFDIYKWHAEVNDPQTYGKTQKLIGDPDAPIGFIIETGIRRAQPIDIPIESKPVEKKEGQDD